MLTKEEKNRIKVFVTSPDYQIFQKVANLLITQIRSESSMKDTEWETLKNTIMKEGQVTGIQRFLTEIFANVK